MDKTKEPGRNEYYVGLTNTTKQRKYLKLKTLKSRNKWGTAKDTQIKKKR